MEQNDTCTPTRLQYPRTCVTLCHKYNIFLLTNTTLVCNNLERLFPCNENQKYIWIEAADACRALWLMRIQLVDKKGKKKLCSANYVFSYPPAYLDRPSSRSRLHSIWLWQLHHNISHRSIGICFPRYMGGNLVFGSIMLLKALADSFTLANS
jgi:hypothetical protein